MADNKEKDLIQQSKVNAEEEAALKAQQEAELAGLQAHNSAQYNNLGQIVGDIQRQADIAKGNDEAARMREESYRYISGLGDTLSSFANLMGVAKGAANQQQTYNSNAVALKAEEARKARKLEMDDLGKRLDELTARQRELKAAGSLAEAQMGVRHQKEQMALKNEQAARAREAEYKERMLKVDEMNAQSAKIRAEAYEYGQENPKPTKTSKTTPKPEHTFEIVGGGSVTIPQHKWTDTAITSVYDIIPDEMKTKRARMVRDEYGEDKEQRDASGNIVYYTPTKQEMLNDIVKAAKTDPNVANALRKYAGTGRGADDPDFE